MTDGGCGACRSTSSGPGPRPSTRAAPDEHDRLPRAGRHAAARPGVRARGERGARSGRGRSDRRRSRGRRAPLRSAFEPRRNPVTVTTLGRTGSMLLMRLLAAHPEVLVYRPHRFEQRIASYWADVLLSLAEPAELHPPDRSAAGRRRPGVVARARRRRCRGGCATRPSRSGSAARRSRTLAAIVPAAHRGGLRPHRRDDGHRRRAAVRGEVEPARGGPAHGAVPRLARDLPGARLPRHGQLDPVLQREAGRRRASGARRRVSDADYVVVARAAGRPACVRAWERRRGSAHLVRYEDLVLRPGAHARRPARLPRRRLRRRRRSRPCGRRSARSCPSWPTTPPATARGLGRALAARPQPRARGAVRARAGAGARPRSATSRPPRHAGTRPAGRGYAFPAMTSVSSTPRARVERPAPRLARPRRGARPGASWTRSCRTRT